MARRIWAITKDPGGQNAVWPVSQKLKLRHNSVMDITNGKAVSIMGETYFRTYLRAESFYEVLDLVENGQLNLPNVLITSTCSNGGVGRDLIPKMKKRNVPTVAVTDFWTGAQLNSFVNSMYWPDAVCVQDNLARDILLDAWHGYSYSRVYVTGQPAFDKLAAFNKSDLIEKMKKGLTALNKFDETFEGPSEREVFDENAPIVLFAGQLKGTAEALSALVKSLNTLPCPVSLVSCCHPRFSTDSSEEERPYREAISLFKNGGLIPTSPLSVEEWSCVADVVVSMSSTVLATAGHFRKECISILFPETEQTLNPKWGLPYERLGTAEVARSQEQLNEIILRALNGGLGLRENQKKYFTLDGNSANRVADVVENMLGLNMGA